MTTTTTWTVICSADHIPTDTGVAAWIAGQQVAVFKLTDGAVHAVDNQDPASGANVLSRGIVGDCSGRAVVASPVYKQRFDLVTGQCLDDPSLAVQVWPVRLSCGVVEVGASPALGS